MSRVYAIISISIFRYDPDLLNLITRKTKTIFCHDIFSVELKSCNEMTICMAYSNPIDFILIFFCHSVMSMAVIIYNCRYLNIGH